MTVTVTVTCSGCGAGVHESEEGRCAFCRKADRGDDQLLSHDSRGWLGDHGERVPCQCGCGMVAVPVVEEPEYEAPQAMPRWTGIENPWGREEIIAAMQAWHARYGTQPTWDVWNKGAAEHPNTARVMRVFGSWNAAIAAAGFEPKSGRQAGGWKPKPIVPRGIHGR